MRVWKAFTDTSSLDAEVFLIVDAKLATYKELAYELTLPDMIDLLEVLEVQKSMERARHKDEQAAESKVAAANK